MHTFSENVFFLVSRDFLYYIKIGDMYTENGKKTIPSFIESRASTFGQNRRVHVYEFVQVRSTANFNTNTCISSWRRNPDACDVGDTADQLTTQVLK